MQWFKKKYRDLQGHQSSKVILDILVSKIAHLTGAENSYIINALWNNNPTVKLEADDDGNRTNQVILPPSKRATALFEYLYDLEKYPNLNSQNSFVLENQPEELLPFHLPIYKLHSENNKKPQQHLPISQNHNRQQALQDKTYHHKSDAENIQFEKSYKNQLSGRFYSQLECYRPEKIAI